MREQLGFNEMPTRKDTMSVRLLAYVLRTIGPEEFLALPDDAVFMSREHYAKINGSAVSLEATILKPDQEPRCRPNNPYGIDPELFFQEGKDSPLAAKRECAKCFMNAACLSYALEHNESFGVWGGTTPRERRTIKKGRRL